jgi:hypothetical protein
MVSPVARVRCSIGPAKASPMYSDADENHHRPPQLGNAATASGFTVAGPPGGRLAIVSCASGRRATRSPCVQASQVVAVREGKRGSETEVGSWTASLSMGV